MACFGAENSTGGTALVKGNQDQTDRIKPLCRVDFTACEMPVVEMLASMEVVQ